MLAQFRRWLDANVIGLLPQAPLAKAFGYALRHWEALIRYTENGVLLPDNNALGRQIRPIALGRSYRRFAVIEGSLEVSRVDNRRSMPEPCICRTTASMWMRDPWCASYELSITRGPPETEGDHLSAGIEGACVMVSGVPSMPVLSSADPLRHSDGW